jgi:hypothetical protein
MKSATGVPCLRQFALALIAVGALAAAGAPPADARHASIGSYIDRGFDVWEGELEHCTNIYWSWRNASYGTYGWVNSIGGCSFNLNLRERRALHSRYGMACTVVIHEMGHLAGYEHVNDPTNIMNGRYERGAVSSAC